MDKVIREAEGKDAKKLESFLAEANLNVDGLEDRIEYYSLLETKNGDLKACIGIEPEGSHGLLRSFVVSSGTAQTELLLLFDRVMRIAEKKSLNQLYLVTNKKNAVALFTSIGFEPIEDIPRELLQKPHVAQVLNVDNSILMRMLV